MAESISIYFEGEVSGSQEVGVQYHAATSEAMPDDKLRALELGAHALMREIMALRGQTGRRVPGVMSAFVEASTYLEVG